MGIIETKAFKYTILFLSLLYSASFITWQMWTDIYYWIVSYPYYSESWMSCLYLYIGNIISVIFGTHTLIFSGVAWIISILSMIILYITYVPKESRMSFLNYFSLGIILWGHWTQGMFNPDTLTLLSIAISCWILNKKELSLHWIFALAIVTATSVAARFPNILIAPILSIYIYFTTKVSRDRLKKVLEYLLLTLVIYYGILALLFNDLNVISHVIPQEGQKNYMAPTHAISTLVLQYLWAGIWGMVRATPIVLISILIYKKNNIKNNVYIQLIFFAILLAFIYLSNTWGQESYGWKLTFSFVILEFLCLYFFLNVQKRNEIILFLLLIFVNAAGSDTGLMKCMVLAGAFVPVLTYWYKSYINTIAFRSLFTVLIVSSVFCYVRFFLDRKFTTFAQYTNACFWQSEQDKIKLNKRLQTIGEFGHKNHNIFYGLGSPKLYVLSESKTPYRCSFWQYNNDSVETERIADIFKNDKDAVVFIYNKSTMLAKKIEALDGILQSSNADCMIYSH